MFIKLAILPDRNGAEAYLINNFQVVFFHAASESTLQVLVLQSIRRRLSSFSFVTGLLNVSTKDPVSRDEHPVSRVQSPVDGQVGSFGAPHGLLESSCEAQYGLELEVPRVKRAGTVSHGDHAKLSLEPKWTDLVPIRAWAPPFGCQTKSELKPEWRGQTPV